MPKLSDVQGKNARLSGGLLFDFDVIIENQDPERKAELIQRLCELFSQQLSACESLLPAGVELGILDISDVDLIVEDDYDRMCDLNPDL
jgi:hypothetical protein